MRIALLKLLSDVPDPKALEVQAQVLQTTKDPVEIALVARQLDLQEPGKYRYQIVAAARAVLDRINRGQLPAMDLEPLLETLKAYEEPSSMNAPPEAPAPGE